MTRSIKPPIPTHYSLLSRLQHWDDQESWKDFFETYWRFIYAVAIKSGLTAFALAMETPAKPARKRAVTVFAPPLQRASKPGEMALLTSPRGLRPQPDAALVLEGNAQ